MITARLTKTPKYGMSFRRLRMARPEARAPIMIALLSTALERPMINLPMSKPTGI